MANTASPCCRALVAPGLRCGHPPAAHDVDPSGGAYCITCFLLLPVVEHAGYLHTFEDEGRISRFLRRRSDAEALFLGAAIGLLVVVIGETVVRLVFS